MIIPDFFLNEETDPSTDPETRKVAPWQVMEFEDKEGLSGLCSEDDSGSAHGIACPGATVRRQGYWHPTFSR